MRSKNILLATCLILAALLLAAGCTDTAETQNATEGNNATLGPTNPVQNGTITTETPSTTGDNNVTVEYTGSYLNGTVFDSSVGGEPFTFTLGEGRVIPGFENAVIGLAVNESVNVTIPAAEAYGEYNSSLVLTLPRENTSDNLEVGSRFMLLNNGVNRIYRVTALNDTAITIDGNPVLAGQDIRFSVKLLSLKKAGA